MTHVRAEAQTTKHRISACRKGRHDFGAFQNVGAGIMRRLCETCGTVSIDLSQADELKGPVVTTHSTIESLSRR